MQSARSERAPFRSLSIKAKVKRCTRRFVCVVRLPLIYGDFFAKTAAWCIRTMTFAVSALLLAELDMNRLRPLLCGNYIYLAQWQRRNFPAWTWRENRIQHCEANISKINSFLGGNCWDRSQFHFLLHRRSNILSLNFVYRVDEGERYKIWKMQHYYTLENWKSRFLQKSQQDIKFNKY